MNARRAACRWFLTSLSLFFLFLSLSFPVAVCRFSVRRIMTRRLRTTGNYTTFIRSLDVQVVAMLLVKRLVLLAVHGEDTDKIQKDMSVDERETSASDGVAWSPVVRSAKLMLCFLRVCVCASCVAVAVTVKCVTRVFILVVSVASALVRLCTSCPLS